MKYLNLYKIYENQIVENDKNFSDWLVEYFIEVDCSSDNLTSLDGFEKICNSVFKLDCSGNKISSLVVLKNSINLEMLNVDGNNLINLDGIQNLIKMKELDFRSNKIKNLLEIKNLINLENLCCEYNQLKNFEFGNFSIEAFELGIDVTDLDRFKKLKDVYFHDNPMSVRYIKYLKKYLNDKKISHDIE